MDVGPADPGLEPALEIGVQEEDGEGHGEGDVCRCECHEAEVAGEIEGRGGVAADEGLEGSALVKEGADGENAVDDGDEAEHAWPHGDEHDREDRVVNRSVVSCGLVY